MDNYIADVLRVRMSLKQHLAVKIVAGYVAFTFVFMEVFYLAVWCRPFSQYWAVPPDNGTPHLHQAAVPRCYPALLAY